MPCPHIITASDLNDYADRQASQGGFLELIYHLIRNSVKDPSELRLPYGDAVNQTGWDGILNTKLGYPPFVPDGRSFWEIGTSKDPQGKATKDFKKRTEETGSTTRSQTTFIFVTPRSGMSRTWSQKRQEEWRKERNNKGWKGVHIIDGDMMANWLREFPLLGLRFAKEIGKTLSISDVQLPVEHWNNISQPHDENDPPLPPELFTSTRELACLAFEKLLDGSRDRLLFRTRDEHDLIDFVSAFLAQRDPNCLAGYQHQCLYVSGEDAWRSFCEAKSRLVFIANLRLGLDRERQDLQTVATRAGHAVIIPLLDTGVPDDPNTIRLSDPSQSEITRILIQAGFTESRAQTLGRIGDSNLARLRGHLLGLPEQPAYVNKSSSRQLAQAMLIGGWNASNPNDIEVMRKLLGKEYGEWMEKLRPSILRPDTPLIQTDEKWRFVAREEAWNALGNHLTNADLENFQEMALTVLGETDPRLDLPAAVYDKNLLYSSQLRKGIAESLVLLGARSSALSQCTVKKAETTSIVVVRELLRGANWKRWGSIDRLLPYFAEAAPQEFISALEECLTDLATTPFHELFRQENVDAPCSQSYLSGLLWALETLAWDPEYLAPVSLILADLASIDPGGKWDNHPASTLTGIYLPWHLQTTASFSQRKAALEAILKEQRGVTWSLLLSLLPQSHGFAMNNRRPLWRNRVPDNWETNPLVSEYWEQIDAVIDLALRISEDDVEKLCALIDRLDNLPTETRERIIDKLALERLAKLSANEKFRVWDRLRKRVQFQRRFSDTDWALSDPLLTKLETIRDGLEPSDPALRYRYLFDSDNADLYEDLNDYDLQRKKVTEARQKAVQGVFSSSGVDGCLKFAENVGYPYYIGSALAGILPQGDRSSFLREHLTTTKAAIRDLILGFVSQLYYTEGITWVHQVLSQKWPMEFNTNFLVSLPFDKPVWELAPKVLGEENEELYWTRARVTPYTTGRDFDSVIDRLLRYGREDIAISYYAHLVDQGAEVNVVLALKSLQQFIENGRNLRKLGGSSSI